MRHLFLMDPIGSIRIDKDSTFALMCEAQRRGHTVGYGLVDGLYLREGVVLAQWQEATLSREQGRHARLGEMRADALEVFDIVWMRKDPPFDMGYIFNTYLLELAEARGAFVVNRPAGLRGMNEKAWAMRFPDLVPTSLLTADMGKIRAFANELGAIVVKPLDGNGGEGVFIVKRDDPNIGVILEASTRHGTRKVLAQRYIPEAKLGDKRIILIDGVPAGALNRVPQGVDHRGNIHVGAVVHKSALTARDAQICTVVGPPLAAAGQLFVGIDVIGDWLTEVNVTSPTGIHEIDAFDGVCLEAQIVDAAIARRQRRG